MDRDGVGRLEHRTGEAGREGNCWAHLQPGGIVLDVVEECQLKGDELLQALGHVRVHVGPGAPLVHHDCDTKVTGSV